MSDEQHVFTGWCFHDLELQLVTSVGPSGNQMLTLGQKRAYPRIFQLANVAVLKGLPASTCGLGQQTPACRRRLWSLVGGRLPCFVNTFIPLENYSTLLTIAFCSWREPTQRKQFWKASEGNDCPQHPKKVPDLQERPRLSGQGPQQQEKVRGGSESGCKGQGLENDACRYFKVEKECSYF